MSMKRWEFTVGGWTVARMCGATPLWRLLPFVPSGRTTRRAWVRRTTNGWICDKIDIGVWRRG